MKKRYIHQIVTMKISRLFIVLIIFLSPFFLQAQVGIGTDNPNSNSSLDVNGRVVIQDLSRTAQSLTDVKMIPTEADGTLIEATLPSSLISKDDTTHEITMNENFGTKNNWDISLDGDNSEVTVFIIRKGSGGNELKIRGIIGGTDGRRIRIINDANKKIKFEEDNNNATAGNKIYIYTNLAEMTTYGSCELIYSTAISDGSGHWNIVQMDEN